MSDFFFLLAISPVTKRQTCVTKTKQSKFQVENVAPFASHDDASTGLLWLKSCGRENTVNINKALTKSIKQLFQHRENTHILSAAQAVTKNLKWLFTVSKSLTRRHCLNENLTHW